MVFRLESDVGINGNNIWTRWRSDSRLTICHRWCLRHEAALYGILLTFLIGRSPPQLSNQEGMFGLEIRCRFADPH